MPLLGVVILSTVLLLITLISIVSAFAKSVKEAQTYVTPLMIVVILVGVTAMFGSGAKTELCYYLIPVYNSVQCMVGIFRLFRLTGFDFNGSGCQPGCHRLGGLPPDPDVQQRGHHVLPVTVNAQRAAASSPPLAQGRFRARDG